MSAPFLLNPSSLGFVLRSPLLPRSSAPSSNQPIPSSSFPSSQAAPAGVWGHFPSQATSPSSSSLNLPASLSLSPAIYAQAAQEPSPPRNGDKRVVDSVHVSFCVQGTDGPAIMAPATGPIGANNVTGGDQMRRDPSKGKAPLILNHAALGIYSFQGISAQVAQDTFFKDRVFDVPAIGADPSLSFLSPATPTFSWRSSPATPTFSWRPSPPTPTFSPANLGVQFYKERLMDEVYMPAHAQGRGAQVDAIGAVGAIGTDDAYMRRDPSKGKAPLSLNSANQVHANEAQNTQYLSLMNQVTLLSQTQRTFDASISDMRSHNLELNRRVVETQIITANKISSHDQEIEKKIEDLYAKVVNAENKGEKMEAKGAKLDEKVTGLQEKSAKLEGELEVKREKFEMLKKKTKKNGKILNYFIGGFVLGVSIYSVRRFLR